MREPRDGLIDKVLDLLRDRRLPAAVEVPLSLAACLSVGCVYGSIYVWHVQRRARRQRLPLMAPVRSARTDSTQLELEDRLLVQLEMYLSDDSFEFDELILERIRSDASLRRLVNDYMILVDRMSTHSPTRLTRVLDRLWPQLLRLPPIPPSRYYTHELSVVLPAYRETNQQLATTLQHAFDTSVRSQHSIQFIVVNAGGCGPDVAEYLTQHTGWSAEDLVVVPLPTAENVHGRGPALNHGASRASGRVLFFLHSDTKTPPAWDEQILAQFGQEASDQATRVHATCFHFGFDESSLSSHHGSTQSVSSSSLSIPPPPSRLALMPVQWMVNVRTRVMKLPYGDQGIAMPTVYFDYIGGFPMQPIMEDYSLMDYLRQRALVLSERLQVLPGSCRVSVRRWHKVGTVYMTLANASLVFRYNFCGWGPDDIFNYYYKRPFVPKKA